MRTPPGFSVASLRPCMISPPHRRRGIADRETRDDLGAAADVAQVHVPLDAAVHVVVAVAGQGTAGGENGAEGGQVVGLRRYEPFLLGEGQVLALVPKTVTRSLATMVQSASGVGANGAPSYSTTVAPTARALTSQFHIIHPHVVT